MPKVQAVFSKILGALRAFLSAQDPGRAREAYLAQATDLVDLERRMRALDLEDCSRVWLYAPSVLPAARLR
jgi:hypothetical protein